MSDTYEANVETFLSQEMYLSLKICRLKKKVRDKTGFPPHLPLWALQWLTNQTIGAGEFPPCSL